MVNKMSSRKLLVHSLGVVLVFVQILTPLSGLPIIGEHSDDKESFYITESRETVPFTAFTKQMSPSTDRPVVSDEPEMSSHKPSKSAAINKKNDHRAHLIMDFDHWVDRPAPQAADGEAHWSYKDPGAWSTKASTCGGRKQSPIDIQPKSTVLTAYPKFTFHNYGMIEEMSLTNNGHTALYSLPSDYPKEKTPFITGGGLSDRYDFIQFHFHWGSDTSKGSEHLIRSKSYPAELHLVHFNTKYGSFAAATNHSDGLAVLAVFIKVDSDDNLSFEPVVKQLNEVMKDGDETILKERVSLNDLLPSRTSSFYRYDGSLTTPGCNEIVTWTIFDNPITVSDLQLSKFRKLSSGHGPLVDNFRPTMPLNGRVVTYRSFTGCEISQSWPLAASPFSEAYKWSKCLMGFAFKTLSS